MEYLIYILLSPIAFCICIITLFLLWKYRKEEVGFSLLIYFLLVLVFLITNILELIAEREAWMLFWTKTQITSFALIPFAWIYFALKFSQFDLPPFGAGRIAAVGAVPAVTIVLVWLYPLARVFYRGHGVEILSGYSTLGFEYGPFFWFFGTYTYLLLIGGSLLMIFYMFNSGRLLKKQGILIFCGAIFPITVNLLYILPLPIFAYKDYTPLAYALSGIFFFAGIYWFRFLEVIPVAKNMMFQEMDVGLIVLGYNDLILEANKAAFRLLGVDQAVIGQPVRRVAPLWEIIRGSYDEEKSIMEAEIDDGIHKRKCSIAIAPIQISRDRKSGKLITINDISLLLGLYDEKITLLTDMEAVYKELNSTQLQLIHKEKLSTLGQLSAGLAHEIKNPLSYLLSNKKFLYKYIRDIMDNPGAPENERLLEEINDILSDTEDGLTRILGVVNNLLNFSRSEDERSLDHDFDVNANIDRTVDLLRGMTDPSVEIRKEYGDLEKIACYGSEINQVFLNLLNNALHAVEKGGGPEKKIIIRTRREGDGVVCQFLNTGQKIPEDLKKRIFEPFFTTKAAGEGTGLGLSIVAEIVEKRHRGSIAAIEEGEYTLFQLVLPDQSAVLSNDSSAKSPSEGSPR